MSAPTLQTIREALASQIRNNVSRQTTVRAYPPVVNGPSITVLSGVDYVTYFTTFGPATLSRVRFDVLILPGGADESAHIRLDDYLSPGSPSSVVDAINTDPTLGIAGVSFDFESITFEDTEEEIGARLPVVVTLAG